MTDVKMGVMLITILAMALIVSGTIIEISKWIQSEQPPCTQESSSADAG